MILKKYNDFLIKEQNIGKLLYHSTDIQNAINILNDGEIKTYENILKDINQDPLEWYDDPNYGRYVYVSDFLHNYNNYYGLSDLDVTFVIDSNKISHKMYKADERYEGGTISVEGNISLNNVIKVIIHNKNEKLIKTLKKYNIKYTNL